MRVKVRSRLGLGVTRVRDMLVALVCCSLKKSCLESAYRSATPVLDAAKNLSIRVGVGLITE